MVKKVSAAEAKAHLSALMAEVAYGGERVVIERRGKKVAALVSIGDLERLGLGQAVSARPRGALALAGAWGDISAKKIDRLVEDIYDSREQDEGRAIDLEG